MTSSTPALPAYELNDRDRRIVQFVARFQQVASSHIHALVFPDVSRTPTDRALRRLVEQQYLIRIERRLVGGSRGGSGQYVYSLGRRGFYMFHTGRYAPARAVRYHALAIVDCVVILRQLERDGRLSIAGMTTEPDCWVRIGDDELKPDLYVEVTRAVGDILRLWLEVDMGTESQRQVKDKLERYWRSYNNADGTVWTEWPRVLWVAVDDEREKELRWLIGQGPGDAQVLFQVTTIAKLSQLF